MEKPSFINSGKTLRVKGIRHPAGQGEVRSPEPRSWLPAPARGPGSLADSNGSWSAQGEVEGEGADAGARYPQSSYMYRCSKQKVVT